MSIHQLAGKPAPIELLAHIPHLMTGYYAFRPTQNLSLESVAFGTSGHRGSSLMKSFNETHILAICQSICDYRKKNGITGPLFLGKDTHALSEAAFITALEVLTANGLQVVHQKGFGYTPTPVISYAILNFNKKRKSHLADGIVLTPSHNPPEDGGIKYNPTTGGPADTEITRHIEDRANKIIENKLKAVKRIPYERALQLSSVTPYDFVKPYVRDLKRVIDMDMIAGANLKLGVDPMGGSGIDFWEPIAETYHLNISLVNKQIDPTFSFMTVDRDGKIRMDCSSPYAMAGLIKLKDRFDIAFGNDPDYDRHGIVTRSVGLMNPNHYLSVAVWYLFQHRPKWGKRLAVGKTLVSSSMIDRVARHLGKNLVEVPVGFKWFVNGLLSGHLGFAGEESAGASFLRSDGTVWTTDKDGFILDLLAAEITARLEKDPGEIYRELENMFGSPAYERIDAPANSSQKKLLSHLSPEMVQAGELAGEKIIAKLTRAPGNNAPIGGLKVITENGWFAARPSGTEDVYKIYAESFKGQDHLKMIQKEAQTIIQKIFAKAKV